MKIFYITAYCGDSKFKLINKLSKVKPSPASQTLNKYIVEGINENNIDIETFVYLPCAPFPKCRISKVKYEKIIVSESHLRHIVPFINFQLIKQVSLFISLLKLLISRYQVVNNNEEVIIFSDYLYLPSGLASFLMKRKYKLKTLVLIPDIPKLMFNYMDKKDYLKQFLLKPYLLTLDMIKKTYSGFLLMTEDSIFELDLKNKNTLIVEGIFRKDIKDDFLNNKEINNCIMYTGGLYKEYGILNLIESVDLIDDNTIEVWIYGTGELENEIIELSKKNRRIKFKGMVSNQEIKKIQSTARLLINPRPNTYDFTKFTFPSKILEYMTSGRPVALTRLDGIPDEYYNHVFEIEDFSSAGIAKCINDVLLKNNDEIIEKVKNAKRFIIERKNPKLQCKRIIDFIMSIDK